MSERRNVHGVGDVYDLAKPSVSRFSERLKYGQDMHEVVDPLGYLSEVSSRIKEGAYPIFYSNHTQHLNIAAFREVISLLNPRPLDMQVIVAHTLVNEGQDPKIVEFAKNLVPALESERMHLIPVAREKDIKKIRESSSEEKALIAGSDTYHNLRHLALTFKEDAGLIFFPEATTEGAVKENGKRKGMVEVTDNLFDWLISNARRYGRELSFIPVGMVDTNRILEPRTSQAHLRAKYEIGKDKFANYFGLDLGPIAKIAKVVIGRPFALYDIWEDGVGAYQGGKFKFKDKKELNEYVMKQVAHLLPNELKGFYQQ